MNVRILLSANLGRENYIQAVEGCGGIAVVAGHETVESDYDGLILCGGSDIDPHYYGEEINGSVDIDYERDRKEFALAKAFIEAGKPVLGICRGHQLLNVYFGGTLYQNIEEAVQHRRNENGDQVHKVKTAEDSIYGKLYGRNFSVNSSHHQGVLKAGKGLRVTMTTEDGRVVEGFEHESLPVIGVQFHPERMCFKNQREDTVDGSLIFKYFIALCENCKKTHEKEKMNYAGKDVARTKYNACLE